ncbi:MAG: phosphate regulon sensor histidine kinase PhoR [Salinisphaeraceae bacterium]
MRSAAVVSAWRREVLVLAVWLAAWTLIGAAFGYALWAAFGGLAVYLLMHLAYTNRLHRWLVNDDREPPEGLGVWQDIFVEFNRLKQRNRKRKKRLKSIVNEFQASTAALPDGAVVLDGQGRIVWFNQAAAALVGLRAPQDLGQRIANLVRHPRFSALINAPDAQPGEVEVPSPISEHGILMLRIIPYGNGQRLLIARDVSEQKRMEATRRDFVANASHELRTPLTVLRGYLEMMEEETGKAGALEQWQAPVREMGQQALRMSRIIESLLRLARVEAEGLQQRQEVVDMAALIERLVADARRRDTAGLRFETELQAGLSLFGRPGELESVAGNLIANAVQYTPAGGEIAVRWWLEADTVNLSVSDTGIGIDQRHLPRLTERFYRVDAARSTATGGTGLGLAIVKHCLEHHEAELSVDSEPGIGSTFICRFPRQRAHVANAA